MPLTLVASRFLHGSNVVLSAAGVWASACSCTSWQSHASGESATLIGGDKRFRVLFRVDLV